jgi:hypothetical protein
MTIGKNKTPGRARPGLVRVLAFLAVLGAAIPAAVGAEEGNGLSASLIVAPDNSRVRFEEGRRFYEDRRLGEALAAFQSAAAERSACYEAAAAVIANVTAQKDLARAKDSLPILVRLLAQRDLIDADLAKVEAAAGGSLRAEAEALKTRNLSADFSAFLKALLLVLDKRPAAGLNGSIAALKAACVELAAYPEAEYWIGRVYQDESEYRLAELQYRKAWDLRASLEIPGDRFEYLRSLASLYRAAGNWASFEDVLLKIVEEDPLFGDNKAFVREAIERTIGREGFDRFYGLYRADAGPWTEAERQLGEFYLDSGRPQALIYLAASVDAVLTRCLPRILARDPSWEYRDLGSLIDLIQADRELKSYADSTSLFEALYKLGLALDSGGWRESARGIWQVLAARPSIGPWSRASARALTAARR